MYPEGVPHPGPQPPASAPAAPRRGIPTALTVTCVMLVLALVITNLVTLAVLGGLHGRIGRLEAQQAQRQTAQATLRDDFRRADLPGKLARVRDLTIAANQALTTWGNQPEGQKSLGPVQDAVYACDLAIFDYDATAARFPPGMLAGLPIAIDTHDSATDCSRIT